MKSLSDVSHYSRFLEGLLAACLDLPYEQKNCGRPTIDLRKQILITLWILENPECLRSVADRFDIRKGSAFRVYHRVCGAIANNLSGQKTPGNAEGVGRCFSAPPQIISLMAFSNVVQTKR